MKSRKLDKPPSPQPIDLTISHHQGSTTAIDATISNVQARKAEPTPTLKGMVESLSRENGRLREELAYRQNLQSIGQDLQEEVEYVLERLQLAVITFQRGQKDIMNDRVDFQ
ncbi:hypothetical protein AUP68_02517 [Ilyonectria robusta]